MKKIFLTILLGISLSLTAQNTTLAKLAFEEAEEAYNNNNFETTLQKLEEAEQNFGKINPPILHLRIVSQFKTFEAKPNLELAKSIKENCELWFKNYSEDEGLFVKTRDVYKIKGVINSNAGNEEQLSNFMTKK